MVAPQAPISPSLFSGLLSLPNSLSPVTLSALFHAPQLDCFSSLEYLWKKHAVEKTEQNKLTNKLFSWIFCIQWIYFYRINRFTVYNCHGNGFPSVYCIISTRVSVLSDDLGPPTPPPFPCEKASPFLLSLCIAPTQNSVARYLSNLKPYKVLMNK